MTFSSSNVLITIGVTNGASLLVCLFASACVGVLRLHRRVVYRLALYQVLSALFMAAVAVVQVAFVGYQDDPASSYGRLCVAVAWFTLYSQWTKLLFTACVTIHVFCFGVFRRDLKRLEPLYLTASLIAPAALALAPLVTGSYGLGPFGCWIHAPHNGSHSQSRNAVVERFVLWDGPALVILLAASAAMTTLVAKLTCLIRSRDRYRSLYKGDPFWKALKRLLPLAAFPVLFCVFIVPQLTFHIYEALTDSSSRGLSLFTSVFFSLWSMASGVTIMVHICIARRCKSKETHEEQHAIHSELNGTSDAGSV